MARAKFPTHIVPATGFLRKWLLSAALCAATAVCIEGQSAQQSSADESWTATRDNTAPNANPSRTTESHSKSGNRTVDRQRVDLLGPSGGYQPSTEIETETVQVDTTTTRTVVRSYRWDGNGQKILARVSEQESKTTTSGDTRTERKTSAADVNGNLQVLRREIADTKKVSPNVEETKNTIYERDSYGGFSQAQQTREVKTRIADDSTAVKKTTLVPDGNGNWQVSDVTEKTIKDDGPNRTTEERVSHSDLNGRLYETGR